MTIVACKAKAASLGMQLEELSCCGDRHGEGQGLVDLFDQVEHAGSAAKDLLLHMRWKMASIASIDLDALSAKQLTELIQSAETTRQEKAQNERTALFEEMTRRAAELGLTVHGHRFELREARSIRGRSS